MGLPLAVAWPGNCKSHPARGVRCGWQRDRLPSRPSSICESQSNFRSFRSALPSLAGVGEVPCQILLDRAEICYWRTTIGEEVDFVVETGGRLLPIEVKATGRPTLRDAASLRTFRTEYGKKARAGLLLHAGTTLEWLTADVLAAPWWRVF
jgi:hypothetical protein